MSLTYYEIVAANDDLRRAAAITREGNGPRLHGASLNPLH